MRVSASGPTEAQFQEDILGGVKIQCGSCNTIFDDKSKSGEPTYCPNCGYELFYRPWWEW